MHHYALRLLVRDVQSRLLLHFEEGHVLAQDPCSCMLKQLGVGLYFRHVMINGYAFGGDPPFQHVRLQ